MKNNFALEGYLTMGNTLTIFFVTKFFEKIIKLGGLTLKSVKYANLIMDKICKFGVLKIGGSTMMVIFFQKFL